MSAPITSAASSATGQGRWCLTIITAAAAPTNAAREPTERSMCPAMMTIIMPIARMRM